MAVPDNENRDTREEQILAIMKANKYLSRKEAEDIYNYRQGSKGGMSAEESDKMYDDAIASGMTPLEAERYVTDNGEKPNDPMRQILNKEEGFLADIGDAAGNVVDSYTGKTQADAAEEVARIQAEAAKDAAGVSKYMYDTTREDTANQRGIMDRTMAGMEQNLNSGGYNAPAYNFDYAKYGLTDPAFQNFQTPTQMPGQTPNQMPQSQFPTQMPDANPKTSLYPNEYLSQEQINNFSTQNPNGDIRDAFTQEQKDAYYSKYPDGDIIESLKHSNVTSGTGLPISTTDIEGVNTPQASFQGGKYAPPEVQQWYTEPEAPEDFSFTMDDFQDSDYYNFLQDESAKGVRRGAAGMGGLMSGSTLTELGDRSNALAAGEYGNQFERALQGYGTNYGNYQDQRNFGYGKAFDDRGFARSVADSDYSRNQNEGLNQFNMASTLAGLGGGAFQTGTGVNQGYASQMGNILGQGANAQAAGIIGESNARVQGYQNMMNMLQSGGGLIFG